MEQRRTDQAGRPPLRDDIFDEARTARATVSDQGVVTGWSEGARRLLGHFAEEVLGASAARLLADDIPPDALRGLLALPRWKGRIALRHRDGHRLEAYVLAHHGEAGSSGGPEWLLVSPLSVPPRDPPDDTPAEWSFTQSPCCSIALYDTGLRLRRANEDMQRVMDLTEDEMRGLRVTELVPGPEGEKAEQLMGRVLRTGEPQSMENFLRLRGEPREHAWSVFLSPLRDADGALRGVCLTAHDISEQYWARRRLMLLNDANARIGSTLDVTRTAQELADVAVPDFADFAGVDLLADPDPGGEPVTAAPAATVPLRRVALRSVLPGAPETLIAVGQTEGYPPDSPAAESLTTGRAVLRDPSGVDTAGWTARDTAKAARAREFGIHSALVVPLRARGTTLGVAFFARHRRPDAFEKDDLLLAEEITGRAAVCIDNARRYTRERETAVALQRTLLPQRLPEQAAVEVASRYLPTGAVAGVGGDWFDVIPLSGARVALAVGDVVGHGIHASATMGRLRTAVRTLADVDLPPDELLTHLDDLVARLSADAEAEAGPRAGGEADGGADDRAGQTAESAGGFGATCLYAVYDPVSRYCTLARAGHPVPAVVAPDGAVDFLDVPAGPPLGLGGLPFESTRVLLPEGSLLVLYTNGLIESRHHDADEGLNRLRGALSRPAPSLDALCDAVLGALPPGRPADDIALLIARTRALHSGQVAAWDLPADPSVVAQARKHAATQLSTWGLGDAGFVTELVVSELVTNAIRHAESPIQLRLIYDRNLICEVSDGSGTTPHARRARSYDEGGRGLMLVAQLTRAWGTRQTATGKTIWAEQTLGDLAPAV